MIFTQPKEDHFKKNQILCLMSQSVNEKKYKISYFDRGIKTPVKNTLFLS